MRIKPKLAGLFCIGVLWFCLGPDVYAREQKSILTAHKPFQIPGGKVLPAGTYTFKVVRSDVNQHIVRILNEDETHVFATVLAVPGRKLKPSSGPEFTFREMPGDSPRVLRAWFWAEATRGYEFPYARKRAIHIASATKEPVASVSDTLEEIFTEPVEPDGPLPEELQSAKVVIMSPQPQPTRKALFQRWQVSLNCQKPPVGCLWWACWPCSWEGLRCCLAPFEG